MKKISRTFIPALALVLAVLTSCEPDSVSGGLLSSGKPFTFTIGNGSVSSTRGMEIRPEVPASSLLCTLESADEDGDAPTLSITQTVTSLDDEWLLTAEADGETSLTRGMPVFTENLGTFAATTYAALTSTTGTTKPNEDQLNTSTLSKTFNLIPQTFSSERKLTIILNCTEVSVRMVHR